MQPGHGRAVLESDIYPTYLNNPDPAKQCTKSGCHDENGQSALRFMTDPVDLPGNYKESLIYLNCATPEASELLTKPLAGVEPHGGGDIFADTSDPAVQTFLMWFQP